MRLDEIFEARSNPTTNKIGRESVLDALKKYSGQSNIFVTFAQDVGKMSHPIWDNPKNVSGFKLGINPLSDWEDTPIGIYSYPIDYVIAQKRKVPYARQKPFLQIFKANGNFLNTRNYTDNNLRSDLEKIRNIANNLKWDEEKVNYIFNQFPKSYNPAQHIWIITRLFAEHLMSNSSRPYVNWNKLFRMIGYDGVIDNGYGVIDEREPTQSVFFSASNLTLIDVIENKKQHQIGFDENDPEYHYQIDKRKK